MDYVTLNNHVTKKKNIYCGEKMVKNINNWKK